MTTPTPARVPTPVPARPSDPSRHRKLGQRGQTTAEYALVLLGAAAVALLVVLWAKNTGKVGDLLDEVLDDIVDTAT